MHHAPTPTPSEPPPIEEGHESSEVRLRGIIIFAIVFAAVCIAVEVIMVGAMDLFKVEQNQLNRSRPGLYKDEADQFPAPRLQHNTTADMNEYRHDETVGLDSYGWANEKEGIGRIPIDRAMKIILQKGLPKAPADPAPNPMNEQKTPAPPEASKKK